MSNVNASHRQKDVFGLPASRQTVRCISLACSFLVALSAGSNYGFSSYSPQLQERLHLTSTQINIVGVMGNMGVYLSGPLWGRLVDRKGLRIPLLLGAILVLLGYGGLSVAYEGRTSALSSLGFLAVFTLFSGLGNCAAFTAAMNAQAKSWQKERRGLCTATVLSGFGLSAFFYSTLSHTLFPGKTGDYLMLLALGSSASFLVGLALIKIVPPDEESSSEDALDDGPAAASSSAEAARRPSLNYVRRRTSSDIGGRAYSFSVPADDEMDDEEQHQHDSSDEERFDPAKIQERRNLLANGGGRNGHGILNTQSGQKSASATPKVEKTGWKLVRDMDFVILFAIMTIISGTGLLVINNIGTMTRTLYEYNKRQKVNGTAETNVSAATDNFAFRIDALALREGDVQQLQAHQVSAISIGNALGRILIGLAADIVVNRSGDASNRVFMLLPVCSLALISQGLAAWPNVISDLKKLFVMSSVTGLMYGTLFGLCPVLTFEWFGLRHFSQNWGIISLSPVLAGNVFNLLFGKTYDAHVPTDHHSHFCPDGEECFRGVFRITAFGAVIASALAVLIIRRRKLLAMHTAEAVTNV